MAGVGSWNHSRKFEITSVTSNTKKRERKTEVGWGWVFKAHLQCHTSSCTSWTCQGPSVQMPSMGDISHSDNYKYMPIYTQTRDRMSCLFFFVCMYTLIIFKRTAFLINLGFINAFIGPTPVPAYYWSSTNIYWKVRQWNFPCLASDCESCLFSSQMATTLKEVTPNLAQIFARSKYPCLASGCSSIVECLPGI